MFTDYAWMADMQVLFILGLPVFVIGSIIGGYIDKQRKKK